MNGDPPPPTGVFVVAAWVEPRGRPPVRARITFTADAAQQPRQTVVTASADEVCGLVRRWWEALSDR